MEVSKTFFMKNILEINDEQPENEQSEIKREEANREEKADVVEIKANDSGTVEETNKPSTANQVNGRKVRRCFREEQLQYLERCFMEAIYPEASTRKRIAKELMVSNDRVQVWFQNRRAKARKHWKQQFCDLTLPSRRFSSTRKEYPHRQDLRIPSPSSLQYGQRNNFRLHRCYRRITDAPLSPLEGPRAQIPPNIQFFSCCSMPPSSSQFQPYDPRRTHSPTPQPERRLCHCVQVRPRPT